MRGDGGKVLCVKPYWYSTVNHNAESYMKMLHVEEDSECRGK